jgi:pyruvate formate lyase activating enzyme
VLIGRQMTVEEVLREIERDVPFFEESGGGVTFSGGEPLLQHEFLAALLKGCRDRRISTAVDTTGYAAKETVREIAALTDLFLYDLKTMDDTVHRAYTGVSNVLILSNLQEVSVMKKEIIIRVPLIPGVNDSLENIRATGRFVASLGSAREISLLPFHLTGIDKYARIGRDYTMPHVDPMSQEKIEHIAAELRTFGVPVSTGGAHHD